MGKLKNRRQVKFHRGTSCAKLGADSLADLVEWIGGSKRNRRGRSERIADERDRKSRDRRVVRATHRAAGASHEARKILESLRSAPTERESIVRKPNEIGV